MPVTPPPPTSTTVEQIVSATAALRCALASFEPGRQITAEQINSAFAAVSAVSEIRRREDIVRSVPGADTRAFDEALAGYRSALREWERQLPRVQGWLLAEKARLQARSEHAHSVNTWLETHRQTK